MNIPILQARGLRLPGKHSVRDNEQDTAVRIQVCTFSLKSKRQSLMHAYVYGHRSVHGVCVCAARTPVCDVRAPTCAWWVCTGVSVWYVCESTGVA